MSTLDLVDPELRAALDQRPKLRLSPDILPKARVSRQAEQDSRNALRRFLHG